MKRFFALALIIGAAMAISPVAGAGDAQGPACADVVGGGGAYGVNGTVSVIARLAAAPCSFGPSGLVTYTVNVYSDNTMSTQIGSTSDYVLLDPATNRIGFSVNVVDPDTDGIICVAMTTSIASHVVDRAPNADSPNPCITMPQSESPDWSSFN